MDEEKIRLLLGCRIKQLREYNNLTQEQFCAKINLEQPNLSNIENGKTFPSFLTFLSVMKALNVSSNVILDVLDEYKDIDLSSETDKELFKYIFELPEKTKRIICEIIKNKY